jgi:hypothetical protein
LAVTVFSVQSHAAVIGDYCTDLWLPSWFCWLGI